MPMIYVLECDGPGCDHSVKISRFDASDRNVMRPPNGWYMVASSDRGEDAIYVCSEACLVEYAILRKQIEVGDTAKG